MKQDNKSSSSQEASSHQHGGDPIVEHLKSRGHKVTRKNYLQWGFGDRDYEPSPEEEANIPSFLQLKWLDLLPAGA